MGIPSMEDFYIGGPPVKLFLPIFKMNLHMIVDIASRYKRFLDQCVAVACENK